MSRLTLAILSPRPADDAALLALESTAIELGFGTQLVLGDKPTILAQVAEWKLLPEVVLIERPDGVDPEDMIRAFGDVAPEGEAETILANIPNDITIYRHLKAMGAVEVFADLPTPVEARPTLETIALRESRAIGIDPRRVVYVWSASGGAGGTTFAHAFAHKFASEGRRTLFLDMDIFAAPASFMFNANAGAQETSGLLDILVNPGRVDALFLERAIQKARENLFYLSSRRRSSDISPDPRAVSAIVARAQQNFDMVVVDTPWRAQPEPDWPRVNGPSYIVAAPNPQGLLGFSTIAKELGTAATKSSVTGIINKTGEFRGNDIPTKVFGEGFGGKIFPFPYDAVEAGRLFFDQKTLDQMGGKARRPLAPIMATLPARAQGGRAHIGSSPAPAPVPVKGQEKAGLLSKMFKKGA